ncbi:MAG: GNAT family N-acetyltransferase [Flavobacteriales bacterium]|nr:GNAT family N-acetyltransferase [Flavobacteriales bacterium]
MLTLYQYGVTLKRLEINDIEEVRSWRNFHYIQNKMQFTEDISSEMQLIWFNSINNKLNYYFIIIDQNGKRVGLINSKNVDLKNKNGEGGIFISDRAVWNTITPAVASVILLNFSLCCLQSFDRSLITIIKSNTSAINYNNKLGYSVVDEDDFAVRMELTKESYVHSAKTYLKALDKLYPNDKELIISGSVSDINIQEINDLLK